MITSLIPIVAILAVVILLSLALINDINGTLLATGIAAIAGIAGYEIKAIKDKLTKK